jgi:hypothetical protein
MIGSHDLIFDFRLGFRVRSTASPAINVMRLIYHGSRLRILNLNASA